MSQTPGSPVPDEPEPADEQPAAPRPDAGQQPYGQPAAGGSPYTGPGYQQPYGYGPVPVSPSDERTWAIFAHLGGVFLSFLVPLIIWLVYRERSRYLDDQGKEALNFQITLAIAYVVGIVTSVIGIGVLILIAAWVCSIVFAILAAVACSRQEWYRYPLTFRFIR
ncbi:hypothetical protein ATJ88_2349 [Isoptericola jiangsuensis]|uniref:Tic20 family protein n=1 Tax=Isoptericola jiangsuensis TaxID=548579 RepID=A0A2A9EY16_9MICO|nr:DUF4870 domain-containing protein [Isoptericola jiangsuensis]PFG43643.1 hypothetical protein ATJ88_2349 [Isoptericola jiangsuensis]